MLHYVKIVLKKTLPKSALEKLKAIVLNIKSIAFKVKIKRVQANHKKALLLIKNKDKIKVAFFLIHDSVWKYEGVYRLMEKDERFEPIVVVCPYIVSGEETMLREMNQAYNSFTLKGYNVVKTYNENDKKWLNVKEEVQPDIVFFTNPHKLTKDEYYITNFLDCLTCYVQYSFHITYLHKAQYNQLFHNLLWKAFYETPMHEQYSKEYADNQGKNVIVTGYPGIDKLLDLNYKTTDPWKIEDRRIKRIIWAPHHTIEGEGATLDFSNFLQYADFMLEIANTYSEKIQITFKPHPILKPKLSKENQWGKQKTEEYYSTWENLSNGQLNESDYIDLFLTSDGMIHDSASFMTEYLYVKKPVLFTVKNESILNHFNDFGKLSFQNHYHARNKNEIIQYIENTILLGNDPMKESRESFLKEFLLPPSGGNASKNIFEAIKAQL